MDTIASLPDSASPTFERGLIIGKFLPLHAGHLFLIRSALERCRRLTVLLQSLSPDAIPGHARWNWLRDSFPRRDHPNVRVVHAAEDVPQFPHEHADFWRIWRDLILSHAGPCDAVFSSEDYGDGLAQVLGARRDRRSAARRGRP